MSSNPIVLAVMDAWKKKVEDQFAIDERQMAEIAVRAVEEYVQHEHEETRRALENTANLIHRDNVDAIKDWWLSLEPPKKQAQP